MTFNNSDNNKNMLVAFGPVAGIRAISSREVSVIEVEIPEENHVAATNIFYGNTVLITLMSLENATFGVFDPSTIAQIDNKSDKEKTNSNKNVQENLIQEEPASINAVHGLVSNVRAYSSKGTSSIYIEVPETAHVEVTQMLYARNVLLTPVSLGVNTPFGIIKEKGKSIHAENGHANGIKKVSNFAALVNRQPTKNQKIENAIPKSLSNYGSNLISPVNLVKWVVIRCQESDFQDFLNVRNESQAKHMICDICGIMSRKELITNKEARIKLMNMIFQPYNQRNKKQ